MSPGNSWGYSNIHFLVIKIKFRFTSGEKKLLKPETVYKYFVQDCEFELGQLNFR